jgi:hypothetical protein
MCQQATCLQRPGRNGSAQPVLLIILLALASPAFAQDGARDAATAKEAAQAFRIYAEGVTKTGGRPDLTRLEAAALLDRASSGELIVRRRMIEDMTIRKIAPKTQHDYVEAGTHHT